MILNNVAMLAWAHAVDTVDLCAAIEAYATTRSQVRTLQICLQKIPSLAQRIPEEIILLIDKELYETILESDTALLWRKRLECSTGTCRPTDHMSFEDIQGTLVNFCDCCRKPKKVDENNIDEVLKRFCAEGSFLDHLKDCYDVPCETRMNDLKEALSSEGSNFRGFCNVVEPSRDRFTDFSR